MAARVCILFLVLNVVSGQKNEGIIDHLSNGMKFAKDFLGSESIALKVAEFVVRAFQNANPPQINRRKPLEGYEDETENFAQENRPYSHVEEAPSPMAPLRKLVRLFGLQPNQISAVAVNALVFVAQMISTFLAGPKRSNRPYRYDDTTQWILNKNSRKLQDILATAKNQSLPDLLEDIVEEQSQGEEASCIKLLVCKITPFVTKMQTAVFGESKINDSDKVPGADSMYRHLPTSNEIEDRSAICEQKHRDCDLNE
ncbi:uncharacterized protein LOC133525586 [Cydia pomonella]|uniref:uncharacterized protein LOC133525586 n=1 Tax=Cydia pomonella TaxID=82600 RepID=UPI002ADDB939|nr:uncharacterized protein LOC133525586 [Cydia pomonella]